MTSKQIIEIAKQCSEVEEFVSAMRKPNIGEATVIFSFGNYEKALSGPVLIQVRQKFIDTLVSFHNIQADTIGAQEIR